MSGNIQYDASLSNIFLALAKGEHKQQPAQELHWPVTCPHCMSEDTKPTDETYGKYECTQCGEVFDSPTA